MITRWIWRLLQSIENRLGKYFNQIDINKTDKACRSRKEVVDWSFYKSEEERRREYNRMSYNLEYRRPGLKTRLSSKDRVRRESKIASRYKHSSPGLKIMIKSR